MYLDYSKLEFDQEGRPEVPELVLKTLGDRMIGVIPGVHNLKLNIKFSEPSEISFDVPSVMDGKSNPLYEALTGHRQIYTKHYGVYETMNPTTESDGIREVKHVKGYSYEKTLESKKFFLEEGTFNFWNPAAGTDTVLGRVLESAPGWKIGYVSPSLIGRYRTFDGCDDYLLSFLYNSVPEKYRCVFVFDTYERTINAYDVDEERPMLPIYLDFENLIETASVEELSEQVVTALRPYGADGLSIREVNPIGTNWIYDLSWFLSNGDISGQLAMRWIAWQRSILNNQGYYKGLVALRASETARLLAAKAALTELNGELESLTSQQSVVIQAQAMETTEDGIAYQQGKLDEINQKIAAKKDEIQFQENMIDSMEETLDVNNPASYPAQIQAIVKELSLTNYFTPEEYLELSHYFIEQDITENTFVASTVDASVSGSSSNLSDEFVSIQKAFISHVDLGEKFNKDMYVIDGGELIVSGQNSFYGDIIRGTLEVSNDKNCVLSLYMGAMTVDGNTAPSGTVTISGRISGLMGDIEDSETSYEMDSGESVVLTERTGSGLQFTFKSGSLFRTANVSDYQRYAVEMELYNYAVSVLNDLSSPTYEFSVDAANFLFARDFMPFRNELELGKGVYLNIGHGKTIHPYIIEFELDFEEQNKFSIVFSNRFKRKDCVNTLKDMIEDSYSSSRSFEASKYIYNQTVSQSSMVSRFMSDALDAAKNTVLAAANQSVVINGAGIQIGGDSNFQMRIVDRMIAITDDGWETAKLAIGYFSSPETGQYFGVNAEVIGGKLIVGMNLVIENENENGVMQFKVDSTGAWLNNSTFVLQKDNGGKILLDPRYGIVSGNGKLYDTQGTTVVPSFIDEAGKMLLDEDGMPENASFFLDLRDGNAYFRGNVHATDGVFNGTVYAKDGKFTGEIEATSGTFSGTIKASRLDGKLTAGSDGGVIEGIGLNIGNGKYVVDRSGNVTMAGTINLSGGSIAWGDNAPVKYQFGESASGPWHTAMADSDKYRRDSLDGGKTWGTPYQFKGTDGKNGSNANVPAYIQSTYIDTSKVQSFQIRGNKIEALCPLGSQNQDGIGFILTGPWNGGALNYMRIYAYDGVPPTTVFTSDGDCDAVWDFGKTIFTGNVAFEGDVSGVHATFA